MSADVSVHRVKALATRLREHDAERRKIVADLASAKGDLLGLVADASGVHADAIAGRCRSGAIVPARKAWFYLLVEWTGLTLAEIGKHVNRDHTTVMYSHRTAPDCPKTMEIVSRVMAGKRCLPE